MESQPLKTEIYVLPINKNDKPAILLKKITSDKEIMKELIRAAVYEQPIILIPRMNNKIKTLNTLIEKGFLYRETDGNLYFTF